MSLFLTRHSYHRIYSPLYNLQPLVCQSCFHRRFKTATAFRTDQKNSVVVKLKSWKQESVLTIPNLLCVSRIALTPFIVNKLIYADYTSALSLFVLAGVSDLLDGLIARAFPSQRSNFGSILDPLADKLLVGFVFVSLCALHHLPIYIALLTAAKDLLLLFGACKVRLSTLPQEEAFSWKNFFDPTLSTVTVNPTTMGKINTVLQLSLITTTLCYLAWPGFIPDLMLNSLIYTTACTTVVTTGQYLYAIRKELN